MSDSWITRTEIAADVAAIREVNLQAFGRTYEPDLVEVLRADPIAWLHGLSIVAVNESDEVVGHVLFTRVHIDSVPALSLGPCAVLPAYQNQGVGSALIGAGLAAARAQGERFVILLGHAGYYPRFGFKRASAFGVKAPFEVDDANLMALSLDDSQPVPSGTIRYPASWEI